MMNNEQTSAWGTALLPKLHEFHKKGMFCDVELHSLENRIIMAHSCVLGAASAVLGSQMMNLQGAIRSADVELPYKQLVNLIDFVYTGTWNLSECTVEELRYAATMFDITVGDLNMTEDGPTFFLPNRDVVGEEHVDECGGHEITDDNSGQEVCEVDVNQSQSIVLVEIARDDLETVIIPKEGTCMVNEKRPESANEQNTKNDTVTADANTNIISIQLEKVKEETANMESDGEEAMMGNMDRATAQLIRKGTNVQKSEHTIKSVTVKHKGNSVPVIELPAAYACEFCWKEFSSRLKQLEHKKTHTESKRYKCKYCNRWFKRSNHRLRHETIHTGETFFLYKCHFCPASFGSGSDRIEHEALHKIKGAKPYQCKLCDKGFEALDSLIKHELAHSGIKKFKCDLCDKAFIASGGLKRHMEGHETEKNHNCDICGRKFAYESNLKLHRRIHTGDKRHQCGECGKRFLSRYAMSEHERVHTGEKPHTCEVCGISFTTSRGYRQHMRVHTGERPYACKFCQKAFSRLSGLRVHEKIHTGQKDFSCRSCGKSFTAAGARNKHEQIHLNLKPFTCSLCKSNFSRRDNLETHQKRMHAQSSNRLMPVQSE